MPEEVQFEEESGAQDANPQSRKPSFVTSLIMKWSSGSIKNEEQANGAMLVIAGVAFLLAILILFIFVV